MTILAQLGMALLGLAGVIVVLTLVIGIPLGLAWLLLKLAGANGNLLSASLFRKRLRTFLTVGSIMIAFMMFGLLSALDKAFSAGVDIAGADRMVTRHKVTWIQLLPISYLNRIRAIDGVADVTHATWFGGYFKEPKNFVATFPADIESYLRIYPELEIPPDQKEALLADRTGFAAGYAVAERYGWEVGESYPIRSEIYRRADGSDTWDMTLRAIYRPKDNQGDPTAVMLHNDFFNETLPESWRDQVGWYVIRVADADRNAEVAQAIDDLFANSPVETKTESEKAMAAGFANQVGNVGAIVTAVVTAVFFTMLLVTANTMGQSLRERTSELAVLKTLGFTNTRVTVLVIAEALLITFIGGLAGLGLAQLVVLTAGDKLRQYLAVFDIPDSALWIGIILMAVFGLIASAIPASQALRLQIADALRKA
ncbi:MAG: ABC transporter permease [Gammaproteobacteria bacterium]|nr:ABC transporter permease [Gammaproteobacteria bacterium]